MDILKKIFSILLLVCAVTLFAKDLSSTYKKLIKKYENITSYSADFNQINYWNEIGDTLTSSGRIYYNKENLLLDYSLPKKQKMLLDSTKVIVWDIADKNAIITQNSSSISRPIDIIKEFWKKSQVSMDKTELILKTDQQTIKAKLNNYLIKELIIIQYDGNYVRYIFKNAKINSKIDKNIFELNLPKDTNIMNNTNSEE